LRRFRNIYLKNGLTAFYPFNGSSIDASGNNFNLTAHNGATLCLDRFGQQNKAYQFDGINDYLDLGMPLPQGQSFAVSVWFAAATNYQRGILFHNGIGNANGIGILQTAGTTGVNNTLPGDQIVFYAGGANYYAGIQTDTGLWHHAVLSVNNNSHEYYYDNVKVSSGNWSGYQPTTNFAVGYNITNSDCGFKGKIDDIAWYNRAITAAEVDTLFGNCASLITVSPHDTGTLLGGSVAFVVNVDPNTSVHPNIQWQMDAGTGFVNITNSGPFNGADNDTLIISVNVLTLQNVHFRAIVNTLQTCKDTSAPALLKIWTTSIEALNENDIHLKIYPNPSNGDLNISYDKANTSTPYDITIYTITGRMVWSQQGVNNSTHVHLPTSGVYFLTITNGGKIVRRKIVIN